MLMMVVLLTTGFKWGSGDKAEVEKAQPKAPAATPVAKPAGTPVAKPAGTPVAKLTVTPDADGGGTPPSVSATLQAQDPATLKKRIESLARIGRALKALNETKTGGTPATLKASSK
jgi:hypothetical protein